MKAELRVEDYGAFTFEKVVSNNPDSINRQWPTCSMFMLNLDIFYSIRFLKFP